ncbi:acyl-CoA dehydrogenase family protein [Actinacidiphila guanduensis]|uniref:Acyl-CoA dehydrogenase n=1 Tax=Actinacidiphila guanduensis TaxID=310781 RepID=A0A1H0PWH9_9ACTN|nr:acyl-CoA dehydrogenase family protein [Actinacidiphila guanduensis]SDP08838.1 Acyl-CoA dehydrogenase [Actinacidiphila guanduensis]
MGFTGDVAVGGSVGREELVARARALQPLLREHAGRGEADRRVAPEVMEALTQAGLFRLMKPARLGGHEVDLRTLVEVTEALGEADGSAAWLVGVGAVAAWLVGTASKQAQDDFFGDDPDARVAGGSSPAPARRVEGGYRVSGRWAYSSGAHGAAWASMGAMLLDDSGQPLDAVLCVAPASDLTLERTWKTVGMRGTGSDTLVAEDVFVPEHRAISLGQVIAGKWPIPTGEVMYLLPAGPVGLLALLGPILGLGRAALDHVVAQASKKGMHHTFFARQADSVGVQIRLAEAAVKLKTARLHTYAVADAIDAAVGRGDDVAYGERAEYRAEYGYAAQQVLEALQILVDVHGAGAFAESSPLQQWWRDANTAARHAGLNAAVGYEVYGKFLVGVDEQVSPMI